MFKPLLKKVESEGRREAEDKFKTGLTTELLLWMSLRKLPEEVLFKSLSNFKESNDEHEDLTNSACF